MSNTSKKIEKLKEVNNLLNELIGKLETRLFIENISEAEEKILNEKKVGVSIELK